MKAYKKGIDSLSVSGIIPTNERAFCALLWKLDDCYYEQHVETYSESESHYRQQYTSFDYVE